MLNLIKIKKLFLIILLFGLFIIPSNVKALVKPTKYFYVNDYANILSSETENYIISKSSELEKIDGTQIVVVTVKDLELYSIEEYAYQLFKSFGIGDATKDNGLLLLLSKDDRKFRVEVGNGLEGILPDGKTGRFQDEYIIPYLKENKWDEGIKNGYDAFYREIVELNNLDLSYSDPEELYYEEDDDTNMFLCIVLLILGIIVGKVLAGPRFRDTHYVYWLLIVLLIVIFKEYGIFHLIGYIIGSPYVSFISFIGGGSSGGSSSGGGFSGGGGSSSGGGSSRSF